MDDHLIPAANDKLFPLFLVDGQRQGFREEQLTLPDLDAMPAGKSKTSRLEPVLFCGRKEWTAPGGEITSSSIGTGGGPSAEYFQVV